jgi:uncharacterized protein YjbI with pentapeptide repeats
LNGANLTNARLAGARLDGADFRAYRESPPEGNSEKYQGIRDIPAAVVTGADLRGVNLDAAKTEGVDFSGCSGLDFEY